MAPLAFGMRLHEVPSWLAESYHSASWPLDRSLTEASCQARHFVAWGDRHTLGAIIDTVDDDVESEADEIERRSKVMAAGLSHALFGRRHDSAPRVDDGAPPGYRDTECPEVGIGSTGVTAQ
jgi:hypothetical protein